MGSRWWNEQRQIAYRSTDFHCAACGVPKERAVRGYLNAHEVYEIDYAKGRMSLKEIVPLCVNCHDFIHLGRLTMLSQKGEITQARYVFVIRHGEEVLRKVGLRKPTLAEQERLIANQKVAPWSAWRLMLEGKEYGPKYKSQADWERHFNA
jgi:hypothetical protein